jgi:hypothetical protein
MPTSSSRSRSRAQNDFDEEPEDKGLPDEVVFDGGQVAVDDPLLDETQVDQLDQRGDDWTRPVLFFPDGSSSDASIVLKNTRDQYIRVTLRGLTGVGRVTSILSKDEASKPESRRR